MRLGFVHSYSALPPRFYVRVNPTPVANPELVVFNRRLAEELGLEPDVIEREAAQMLSGNRLPEDSNADCDGVRRTPVRRIRAATR